MPPGGFVIPRRDPTGVRPQKLAFIFPYRNRQEHLATLSPGSCGTFGNVIPIRISAFSASSGPRAAGSMRSAFAMGADSGRCGQ